MRIIPILLGFCLSACTAPLQIPQAFEHTVVATEDFDFTVWQKAQQPNAPYKIYIEGDGYAFNAHGTPTTDPTPHGTLMRRIAFGDTHPNVIYMARACQFVQSKKCVEKYWTTARFAPEIIKAQSEAIKQLIHGQPVTLVGFSGGAQIAGLVAVTDPEIKVRKIITIGGNLDHSAWTTYHHVPPLKDSADLNDYREAFAKFMQIHYVGEDDTIMPPFLNQNFVADPQTVIVVDDASHSGGWDEVIPLIRQAD